MEPTRNEKKYKRLFNDTLLFVISNFGSKILVLLMVPLYTSVLTTEEYGVADIVMTTVTLLAQVLTLSIYEATLRFALDKKNKSGDVLSNSILIILLSSVVMAVLALVLKKTDNVLSEYWWLLIALFFTDSLKTCFSNYAKGRERSKIFAIQGIVYTAVLVVSNVVLLTLLKAGINGYLISIIAANLGSLFFIIIAMGLWKEIFILSPNTRLMQKMIMYSIPLVPSAVAWWVNASADKYMLIALVGASANGFYAAAHKIPAIFTALTSVFSQAWRISAISSFEELGYGSDDFYSTVYNTYITVCIYACMIVTFFSQIIAKVLFKADYYMAWVLVPPLLLASIFEAFSGFLASIYAAIKKTNILFISTILGAVFNIALNYYLIKIMGVWGAPIATFVSFIIVWIIRAIVLNRAMKIKVNNLRLASSVLILIICGIYFSFDLPMKYLFYLSGFLVVLFLNFKATKTIIRIVYQSILKYTKKGE